MCKLKYDSLQDVFQILCKKYDAGKVSFFQLFKDSPLYVISENNKIIGLELVGFKEFVSEFYKSKKRELEFANKSQAEEFIKGNLYNLFKTELSNSRLVKEEKRERIIFNTPEVMKSNIKEFCLA